MHICIISPDYPTSKTIDFVFVDQLCRAMVMNGIEVSVVAPQSLTKCLIRHVPIAQRKKRIYVSDNNYFTLIRPKYLSVGNLTFFPKGFNGDAYRKAVLKGFRLVNGQVNVIYGHFWTSVSAAYPLAKAYGIPLIASSGEEVVSKYRIGYSDEHIKKLKSFLSGIIHVSTNNFNECAAIGLTSGKSIVVPNAIDNRLFYPRNKEICRNMFGLEKEDFVIAYVGQFTSRKGTLRLNEALKRLNNKSIKAFFLGKGPDVPDYEGIVKSGTVLHDQLPEYLSAADVFVLPTQNEGCCNAIIEAMACGLPIISSDRPFNYDILDETNSYLVDPDDIDAIVVAIRTLMEDESLKKQLSKGALRKAGDLTLDKRVEKIIGFINLQIGYDKD